MSKVYIIAICLLLLLSATCEASWLFYSKPEYNGRVVDVDTKEPIEGAVVVAIYEKHTLNPPAGSYTNVIGVKETLTDKNGSFNFPSYTTVIHPLSYSGNCTFLIYKPGYGNQGQIGIEHFLSGKAEKNWERKSTWNKSLIFRYLTDGTIEIPRLTSTEDMKDALRNAHLWGGPDIDKTEIPMLLNTVNQEEKKYYLHH